MASFPASLEGVLTRFLRAVSRDVAVSAAYLFGSATRGEMESGSDIDVAVVSEDFRGMRRVDVVALLLSKTRGCAVDLQPIGLTPEDLDRGEDVVAKAVLTTGVPLSWK